MLRGALKIVSVLGVAMILMALAALAYESSRTWATLKAAVPPLGPVGQRMLQDLARESAKESTWLTIRRIPVDSEVAAAAAIEQGDADAALVRSDVAMPRNARSIAVLQTLYAFLLVPPRSSIDEFKGLRDRTIAITPESAGNEKLLDLILTHYGISLSSVRRLAMKPDDVGPAMQQGKIAAVFVVGPAGGVSVQAFQSIRKSMKGTPKVVGVADAEAVRRNASGVEAAEIPKGVFGGSPVQPEEDLTTVGVSVRIVVPSKMPTVVAGELTRVLFEGKAKALSSNPQMREMQQPDSDQKDYPIHPAAQAYFDGETPTFMDRFESVFWIGWTLVGLIGSMVGWVVTKIRKAPKVVTEHLDNLLSFLNEIRNADADQLDAFQARVDQAVVRLFARRETGDLSTEVIALYSMAIDCARSVIAERRMALAQKSVSA